MGSALSTFVGAIGSVKELLHVMAKMCDVFNKPPDHESMGNGPKVGHNRDRLITEAQQQMGMDAVRDYNFIFCGPTKVGKSTLINAIRGVKPNDAGAAGVGISEVTQDVRCYQYLGLPRVKLYDAPGAADRLLDDVMYNSAVDDEQVAKHQLHAQVQNAFQQQVVAYHGPHHLFLVSARQLRLANFDEVAFFEYIRQAAASRQFT
ncbi:hypothetical protein WJX79_008704 [Trebouxia sp. C0005]